MSEHTTETAEHRCDLPHCDGTRLGHDLAAEFPEETRRYEEAMDRLRGPREDRVDPAAFDLPDTHSDYFDRASTKARRRRAKNEGAQ